MRFKFRPFYQSIPECYLVLSVVFYLAWLLALVLRLPLELNPDGVLRVLLVGIASVLISVWGLLGIYLSWRRMPLIDLSSVQLICPLFSLGIWGAEYRLMIAGIILYSLTFFIVCAMTMIKLFKRVQ
jgi:hypothetical protein